MENDINERIKDLIYQSKKKQKEFAELIGTSEKNISNAVLGLNKPSYELIFKIASYYTNLNVRWLITGEGEIWSRQDTPKIKSEIETIKSNIELLELQRNSLIAENVYLKKLVELSQPKEKASANKII